MGDSNGHWDNSVVRRSMFDNDRQYPLAYCNENGCVLHRTQCTKDFVSFRLSDLKCPLIRLQIVLSMVGNSSKLCNYCNSLLDGPIAYWAGCSLFSMPSSDNLFSTEDRPHHTTTARLVPNSTTRTPATDMLYNTTNGQAHNNSTTNLLYNKFTTNGQKFATSQHLE